MEVRENKLRSILINTSGKTRKEIDQEIAKKSKNTDVADRKKAMVKALEILEEDMAPYVYAYIKSNETRLNSWLEFMVEKILFEPVFVTAIDFGARQKKK